MAWLFSLVVNIAAGVFSELLTDWLKKTLQPCLEFRPEKPHTLLVFIQYNYPTSAMRTGEAMAWAVLGIWSLVWL